MVEVYKVFGDVNACRTLAPLDERFILDGHCVLNGKELLPTWNPPKFYIYDPMLDNSVFQHTIGGSFAFSARLLSNRRVMECLEVSGEILPIELETGERYFILNVTACVNALDYDKCVFGRYWDMATKSIQQGGLEEYAFDPSRISRSPIFKIPETAEAHILVSRNTGCLCCPDDFMTVYEQEGLTGLKFSKVWEGPEAS